MHTLLQDLRFAARQLRKAPGFTFTAVLSLALGIGATTAIFSVVHGVLVNPYPYKDADRMAHVELRDKDGRGPLLFVNGAGYHALREVAALDDVFLQRDQRRNLAGDRMPISVNVGIYSPNLFEYMGVPLQVGRGFSAADVRDGSPSQVLVLSHLFWQRQFGGASDVLGKTLTLDRTSYTVIGVAAPRFTWGDSDVYVPGVPSGEPKEYWQSFIKLKPGVTYARAESELQRLVDEFARQDRDYPQARKATLVSLNELVLGRFAGTLLLLFGAVITLLLIGCANVSILLLARGAARQHELAVRASIGAGRGRLVAQLLTESVLLSLTGAALGVALAYWGVEALAAMLPLYSFPHEAAIEVNAAVLAFTALVAVGTGLAFGLSPAWQLSRPELGQLVQDAGTKHSGGAQGRALHRLLIAGQVALTLLLCASAGAATRAFLARLHTPLGFDPAGVVALNLNFPEGSTPNWDARMQARELVRRTVLETPGVETASVSTTWFPPFGGFLAKVEVQGKPSLADAQAVLGLSSPEEFATLRIPVLRGRVYTDHEVLRASPVALVNQSFVRQYLSDADPIGQRVRSPQLRVQQPDLLSVEEPDAWLEVVGVVGDAKNDGLDKPVRPAVFLPYTFVLPPEQSLFVRTAGDQGAVMQRVRERLHAVDPQMVMAQERPLSWWLDNQGWGQERFVARLFGLFAAIALVLAATGVYSVVSYSVSQRTREVGTRMALGATRGSIVGLVLSSTGKVMAAGLAVGIGLCAALNGVLASWAGGSSRDPLTLAASAAVLLVVAAVACAVPAWRAATLDPMRALRTE